MKKLANFIVNKGKLFIILFLLFAIAGAVGMTFVKVNYNMSVYLPKDSETVKSMEVMNEEFGNNGTLTVMATGVSLSESLDLKKEIEKIDNIKSVMWLDTALLSVKDTLPLPSMPDDEFIAVVFDLLENSPEVVPIEMNAALESFFKDDKALFQITFTGAAYDESTVAAIDKIKELNAPTNLSGQSASSYAMQKAMEKELMTGMMIVTPLLLLILFIATSSFFDPVAFIAVIGISVMLNLGTNIFLGSISYLTMAIAALLQVAVSMDYSIFLLHSYKAHRRKGLSAKDSAKTALIKSFSPVSASSLTTIAGFVALMFMRFTLGLDIGLVLAKGILFSLLTVFLFMPGFLVLTDKIIMKGEHRSILSFFKRKNKIASAETVSAEGSGLSTNAIGKSRPVQIENAAPICRSANTKLPFKERFANGLIKARFVLPVLFALLILPAFFAQSNNNFLYGEIASAGGDGSTLMNDIIAIEETFGSQNNAVILLNKNHRDKELGLTLKLMELPCVSSAQSYSLISLAGGAVPDYMEGQFVSENYTRIILAVDTDEESEAAFAAVDSIRNTISAELEDGWYLMGSSVSTQELKGINNKDYNLTTILAMTFILFILLITFRSLTLPVILAVVVQGAIWINLAIPFLLGSQMVFLGYLIISCFQMGCTIDYGILLSSHYIDYRKSMNKIDAAKKAFLSSFGAVTLSASILMMVGFSVGIAGSVPAISAIGLLLGTGTLVSYLLMMFILPQLLVIFDKPIQWTTLKLKRKKRIEETITKE